MDTTKDKLTQFLKSYSVTLNGIEEKLSSFKAHSEKAYVEVATLLPTINSNIKRMLKEIEECAESFKKSGIGIDKKVTDIIGEFKSISQIILDVMSSLQTQDAVKQCIEHTVSSIKITYEIINAVDINQIDLKLFKTINYLKIMPQLIIVQLENVYNKMNVSISELSKKFQNIYEILQPPLTLEALLEGKEEENKIITLKMELLNASIQIQNKSAEQQENIIRIIKKIEKLESETPINTNMLDVSAASTKMLEQPLAELLFLNNSFVKASDTANELLSELFKGDAKELDCSDILERIVKLFSTKHEFEAARAVLSGIKIEKTDDEGKLTLF